jgi:xylan 1,4-beta-xylosidase
VSRPALATALVLAALAILWLSAAVHGDDATVPPAAPPPAAAAAPLSYRNPVLRGDFPDPSVLRAGPEYWAATTSTASAPGFPLLHSTDLVHWTVVGQVFPQIPGWIAGDLWAPELVADPDHDGYLLYYAARRVNGPMCVAVAQAPAPGGPWTDHGPLVCQRLGSIDPTRAVDEHGTPYLIWKEDGNSVGRQTRIWAKPLAEDGLSFTGPKHLLLRNHAPWEGGVVEAPEVTTHDGWFYMFYSGNGCCRPACQYALGVARSRSLLGPWRRDPANPILRPNRHWACPGHASLVDDGRDHDFVLYHAYRARLRGDPRRLGLLDKIDWGADGWPTIDHGDGPSLAGSLPG